MFNHAHDIKSEQQNGGRGLDFEDFADTTDSWKGTGADRL